MLQICTKCCKIVKICGNCVGLQQDQGWPIHSDSQKWQNYVDRVQKSTQTLDELSVKPRQALRLDQLRIVFELLQEEAGADRQSFVRVAPPHFVCALHENNAAKRVADRTARWCEGSPLDDKHVVVLPWCERSHWQLVTLVFKENKICVMEDLGLVAETELKRNVSEWLREMMQLHGDTKEQTGSFLRKFEIVVKPAMYQKEHEACGVPVAAMLWQVMMGGPCHKPLYNTNTIALIHSTLRKLFKEAHDRAVQAQEMRGDESGDESVECTGMKQENETDTSAAKTPRESG